MSAISNHSNFPEKTFEILTPSQSDFFIALDKFIDNPPYYIGANIVDIKRRINNIRETLQSPRSTRVGGLKALKQSTIYNNISISFKVSQTQFSFIITRSEDICDLLKVFCQINDQTSSGESVESSDLEDEIQDSRSLKRKRE